jgi:hypothetical protein
MDFDDLISERSPPQSGTGLGASHLSRTHFAEETLWDDSVLNDEISQLASSALDAVPVDHRFADLDAHGLKPFGDDPAIRGRYAGSEIGA